MNQLAAVGTVTALATFALAPAAGGSELRVWSARAIATFLQEIGGEFERATGHRLVVSSDLPTAFLRRSNGGEPFDPLISGSSPVDQWIRDGRIVAGTRTAIARAGIGVEVKAGSPKPDIRTVGRVQARPCSTRSRSPISGWAAGLTSRPCSSGWASTRQSHRRVTQPESDVVSELVARGEIEVAITVVTEILTTPGVDLVGPLPPEIQSYVTFVAGVHLRKRKKLL